MHFAFGFGAFISPIVVGAFIDATHDITLPFCVLSLLILPMCVLLWTLPPPVNPHRAANDAPRKFSRRERWIILLVAVFLGLYVGGEVAAGGLLSSYVVHSDLGNDVAGANLTAGARSLSSVSLIPTCGAHACRVLG